MRSWWLWFIVDGEPLAVCAESEMTLCMMMRNIYRKIRGVLEIKARMES
jgi:hypothetical protein